MALRGYNPLKVVCSWAPANVATIDIADGRVAGDFFSAVRDNPDWIRESDEFGNATRIYKNNKGGQVTISLFASSPTNDLLSAAHIADRVTQNVVGVLVVSDLSGTSRMVCTGAYISAMPDFARSGASVGQVAWVWDCADIQTFIGGHSLA